MSDTPHKARRITFKSKEVLIKENDQVENGETLVVLD